MYNQSWKLEWDLLNTDQLINLETKNKRRTSINPDIHHSKVPSSGHLAVKVLRRYILSLETPISLFTNSSGWNVNKTQPKELESLPQTRFSNQYTFATQCLRP